METTKKKILVIEDEEGIREVFVKALEMTELYELYQARDGVEGLEIAFDKHPDLILLDLLMPKKDGMAVLKELRADEWGANVLVIIFTNYSTDDEMYNKLTEYSPSYYFVKSDMSINEVIEKVEEVLVERD